MSLRWKYSAVSIAALSLAPLGGCTTTKAREAASSARPEAAAGLPRSETRRTSRVTPAAPPPIRPPSGIVPAAYEAQTPVDSPALPPELPARTDSLGDSSPADSALVKTATGSSAGSEAVPDENTGDVTAGASHAREPHFIDLPTVLQLVNGQNPQVLFARERIQEAFAQLDRAQVLWLPSLRAGITYDKHEGPAQQIDGNMITTSRSALFTGFGGVLPGAATPAIPGLYANFHLADAIFQPRIAERTAASRQAAATAATNDALLESALAYFELLRAEQDRAIAREAQEHTRMLSDLTGTYADAGKGTQADHDRALAELAVRDNDVQRSEEAVLVAATRLAQHLSLDPQLPFQPREPIIVPIDLVSVATPLPDLVARGLTHRPEVAESRWLVAEACERLQRERFAPLIPSVLLGIGYGGFGGGEGGKVSDFSQSFDSVAGAFWEVRNLGFGERSARNEARSRMQQAQWKEVAALDRVAREVVEAHVQVVARRRQIAIAEEGIQAAGRSFERNLERIRNAEGLPLEVLQSIQALTQARREYLRAVLAYDEAQFRLHRAVGWPAEGGS